MYLVVIICIITFIAFVVIKVRTFLIVISIYMPEMKVIRKVSFHVININILGSCLFGLILISILMLFDILIQNLEG